MRINVPNNYCERVCDVLVIQSGSSREAELLHLGSWRLAGEVDEMKCQELISLTLWESVKVLGEQRGRL